MQTDQFDWSQFAWTCLRCQLGLWPGLFSRQLMRTPRRLLVRSGPVNKLVRFFKPCLLSLKNVNVFNSNNQSTEQNKNYKMSKQLGAEFQVAINMFKATEMTMKNQFDLLGENYSATEKFPLLIPADQSNQSSRKGVERVIAVTSVSPNFCSIITETSSLAKGLYSVKVFVTVFLMITYLRVNVFNFFKDLSQVFICCHSWLGCYTAAFYELSANSYIYCAKLIVIPKFAVSLFWSP